MRMFSHIIILHWVFVLFATVSSHIKQSYGDGPHCIWYDVCGKDSDTGHSIYCAYNGTAKPLTDEKAKKIYQDYCPDLYSQNSAKDPLTCCSAQQLYILQSNMGVPKQVLSHCPSCFHNFVNLYCYFTCAPDHSKFVSIKKTEVTPEAKSKGTVAVKSVDCNVTTYFSHGMFNSCKDVQLPNADERALGVLCGHTADECTPQSWLTYLGSVDNGQTPFQINFNITNKSEKLPSGRIIQPMNATIVPCSSPVSSGTKACACRDCGSITCPVPALPMFPCTTGPQYRTQYRQRTAVSGYKSISLVIQRRGHPAPEKHYFPPPSTKTIIFNAIFNKTFLHQVLELQTTVQSISFSFHKTTVTLGDVCLHGNHSNHCVIPSLLQYYQNNHTRIDKIAMDSTGFFITADYLDHALTCFRDPVLTEDLPLNISCISEYGESVPPSVILCGYDATPEWNYNNATALIITFVIKDPHVSEAGAAWRTGLLDFVDKWQAKHKDVQITTYQH